MLVFDFVDGFLFGELLVFYHDLEGELLGEFGVVHVVDLCGLGFVTEAY